MRSRTTLVVVAVAVPLLVLGGVVLLSRDGSKTPARLPISLGATGERGAATTTDAALAPYPAIVYRAADGLPELGGSARAYKVTGTVDAATATRLAGVFGVQGEPVADEYGGFSVTDGDAQVTVYPVGGGGWSYARSTSGSVSSSGVAVACPPDADCPSPETTIPERPANLPSQDEARSIALDALTRAGMNVDGAAIDVVDVFSQWMVHVDAVLDGVAAEGFGATVNVGPDGVIEYANGMLGHAQAADEYPLIGTAKAIENLNAGKGFVGPIPLAARDVATPATAVAPDAPASSPQSTPGGSATEGSASAGSASPGSAPMPTQLPPCDGTGAPTTFACTDVTSETLAPPPPQEVTITNAERVLLAAGSYDGNDLFLVPGYRFTYGQDPSTISVLAIDESYIAPPPVTVPATDDVKTDPGSIEPAPPQATIEPQPFPAPQEKPSTSG
jgi:hypothetical protein